MAERAQAGIGLRMASGNQTGSGDRKAAAPSKPRSKTSRVLGFFTPDLGTGPTQVREVHSTFLLILATLFASANVIDRDHPYLKAGAHFTLGELFATTLAKIDWRNKQTLPQTVFFCAVWGLMASMVLYLVTAVLLFVATPSHAYAQTADTGVAATDSSGMFSVPDDDLAQQIIKHLILGDAVDSQQGTNPDGSTQALSHSVVQEAFRDMLKYYSSIILIIASFMVLYHIIMLIVQSAWSGKPLEGANQIWGPLRLAIAIGLLVPLSSGLNSGQYIVLKVAEIGSAAGTKAWNLFTTKLIEHTSDFDVRVEDKAKAEFMKMILVYACQADINAQGAKLGDLVTPIREISNDTASVSASLDETITKNFVGPLGFTQCGSITTPKKYEASGNGDGAFNQFIVGNKFLNATATQQIAYGINNVVADESVTLDKDAKEYATKIAKIYSDYNDGTAEDDAKEQVQEILKKATATVDAYYNNVRSKINGIVNNNQSWAFLQKTSWIMAGGYYMQLSAYQHTIYSAAQNSPHVELGPVFGRQANPGSGVFGSVANFIAHSFNPAAAPYASTNEEHFLTMLPLYVEPVGNAVFAGGDDAKVTSEITDVKTSVQSKENSVFSQIIKKDSIINIFKDQIQDPFAALVNAGNKLLTAGIASFVGTIAIVGAMKIAAGVPLIGAGVAGTAEFLGNFIIGISFYLILMGALLAILLPFVPVTKFLGGVITWMLALMEALVGMPLFALAHLTPGGNGLLDPARHGYVMLLHIALRPMLLVFGMIIAIIIVTPALYILNMLFVPTINAAWGPTSGGLILALVLFSVWAWTAYGIVKKIFGFMDYVSHATMQWFGKGNYNFERYRGEENAFAAYQAIQTGAGMFKDIGGVATKGLKDKAEAKDKKLEQATAETARNNQLAGFIVQGMGGKGSAGAFGNDGGSDDSGASGGTGHYLGTSGGLSGLAGVRPAGNNITAGGNSFGVSARPKANDLGLSTRKFTGGSANSEQDSVVKSRIAASPNLEQSANADKVQSAGIGARPTHNEVADLAAAESGDSKAIGPKIGELGGYSNTLKSNDPEDQQRLKNMTRVRGAAMAIGNAANWLNDRERKIKDPIKSKLEPTTNRLAVLDDKVFGKSSLQPGETREGLAHHNADVRKRMMAAPDKSSFDQAKSELRPEGRIGGLLGQGGTARNALGKLGSFAARRNAATAALGAVALAGGVAGVGKAEAAPLAPTTIATNMTSGTANVDQSMAGRETSSGSMTFGRTGSVDNSNTSGFGGSGATVATQNDGGFGGSGGDNGRQYGLYDKVTLTTEENERAPGVVTELLEPQGYTVEAAGLGKVTAGDEQLTLVERADNTNVAAEPTPGDVSDTDVPATPVPTDGMGFNGNNDATPVNAESRQPVQDGGATPAEPAAAPAGEVPTQPKVQVTFNQGRPQVNIDPSFFSRKKPPADNT